MEWVSWIFKEQTEHHLLVKCHLPSLIQINNEHNVIPETGQAMSGGHDDYKCEHVVNEGVERLQRKLQISVGNWGGGKGERGRGHGGGTKGERG